MGALPELPEVETVRRLLLPDVQGRVLARAEVRHGHVTAGVAPARFAAAVRGRTVTDIARRGKYLVFRLGAPGDEVCLVVHLRMTGRLAFLAPGVRWLLPEQHTHAVLHLAVRSGPHAPAAGRLVFYDVRKFGRLRLARPEELAALLPRGRDPLLEPLDGAGLAALLAGRRSSLKALLLRQDLVCGLGNIYADEALHRAGLHPGRPGATLEPAEWERLACAIREVLAAALRFEGTTLFDYRRPDGEPGAFARFLRVYGRAGQPCGTCGATVAAVRLGGRTTAFCPHCQPASRRASPPTRGRRGA